MEQSGIAADLLRSRQSGICNLNVKFVATTSLGRKWIVSGLNVMNGIRNDERANF